MRFDHGKSDKHTPLLQPLFTTGVQSWPAIFGFRVILNTQTAAPPESSCAFLKLFKHPGDSVGYSIRIQMPAAVIGHHVCTAFKYILA